MVTFLKHKAHLLSTAVLSVALVGCPGTMPATSQTSFVPGTGNSAGKLTVGDETFDIQTDGAGNISKIVSNKGGSFEVDEQGNFTNITTADGSTLDLTANPDGSFNVVLMDSQLGTIPFTIPAGVLVNAKALANRAQSANISCDDISLLCQTARFIIDFFLTDIVDEIVATAVEQTGVPDFLIRPTVQAKVDSYVKLITDFCDGWAFLLADPNEGCPL